MSSAGGIAGVGTIPGQAWFDIIKRPTVEEFAAAFSPNAVLEASVVSGVVRGATDIRHVFNATRAMYDKIAFVHQADDGASTYLEWEGSFHGRPVAGVTILA
ncbi:hypothetical protein, partial [Bosea sp. TAB14]|uniref:hypothetical protein n=1 Tax=Bosea sp. TAB14 TaxID=3237481 RepID=UPI003F8F8B70